MELFYDNQLRLAADDPPRRPIAGVGDVFTVDGGESWAVHLLEENEPRIVDDSIITSTQQVKIVCVNGRTGAANWALTL
ncbi:MAG: hypothetical protein U0793_29735 [Gemmataceae bacterium]